MKIFGKLEAAIQDRNRILLCVSKENEEYIANLIQQLDRLIARDVCISISPIRRR